MKILYIGLIPPEIGGRLACGAAVHGWELANEAQKRGNQVYFLSNINIWEPFTIINGIKIIRIQRLDLPKIIYGAFLYLLASKRYKEYLFPFSLRENIAIFSRSFFIRKIMRDVKPDIVHIQGEINWAINIRMYSLSIPIIISCHSQIKYKRRLRDQERIITILRCADSLIFVSKYVLPNNNTFHKCNIISIHIINNPIDPNKIPLIKDKSILRNNYEIKNEKVVFFSGICESIKIKGLDILLDAYKKSNILRETTCLYIIADEKGRKIALEYFLKYNIKGKIFDFQPLPKLIELYNLADVFVMPSRSEAFPSVFLESLLAGTPIVGFSDSLDELRGIVGYYIGEKFDANKETAEDLKNKIVKTMRRRIDRSSLRLNIAKRLSWEIKYVEYDKIYKSLSKGK